MAHLKTATVIVGALAIGLLNAPQARAATIALDFTGGVRTTADPPPVTVGWSFTVNEDLVITHLGFWDETPGTPLTSTHDVGVWTAAGTLLGTATVLQNSPILDDFRYVGAPNISLLAGQTYVIGALITDPAFGPDNFYITGATVLTAPELTFVGSRLTFGGPGLLFPGVSGTPGGRFGPNFQFETVPEPSTLLMFGGGLAALARRRAQKRPTR